MAQITDFFVGANSGEGFRNLFPEMVDIEDTYDLMVLKGGPGVGKNTFMKEVARAMEAAGTAVERLWCSGDPDSLDGVVLPELRCAVVDGTSPHASASKGQWTSAAAAKFEAYYIEIRLALCYNNLLCYAPAAAEMRIKGWREAQIKVSPAFSKAVGCRGKTPARAPQGAKYLEGRAAISPVNHPSGAAFRRLCRLWRQTALPSP